MFPRVKIHLQKLRENAEMLTGFLKERGIETVAVTKVFGADPRVTQAYYDGGIRWFADARMQNLKRIDPAYGKRMLLRIPMRSELDEVIRIADCSLQSDPDTLYWLNEEAKKQNRKHSIILMLDLGDLREGIFSKEELYAVADRIMHFSHLEWVGTGTNLTCYGGILPSSTNLESLRQQTELLRARTGLALPIVSAGNSSSLFLTPKAWPKGLNQLRIGEALAMGTEAAYGDRFLALHTDAFELEAQIVESRVKPSMPIGEIGKNAFGETPEFEDRGNRHRVIVAVGRQDADAADLIPRLEGLEILGASSDHMLLDAQEVGDKSLVATGETLTFGMNYRAVLRSFTSEYVDRLYVDDPGSI